MLKIITVPAKSLREKSKEIDREFLLTPEIQNFIAEMIPIMYETDGIGLAAPQVGKNIRICIIGKEADKSLKEDLVLINPAWEKLSRKKNVDTEGCLSVPNTFGKVKRYSNISVKAWDKNGGDISFEAKNFLARVIQHEVDHLEGILFIDKAKQICKTEDEQRDKVCLEDLTTEKNTRL